MPADEKTQQPPGPVPTIERCNTCRTFHGNVLVQLIRCWSCRAAPGETPTNWRPIKKEDKPLKASCALYATPWAIGKTPRATRLKCAFCTAVVKNPRTLCVSAGALLHQRAVGVVMVWFQWCRHPGGAGWSGRLLRARR